jgi:hypothetical protein
MKFFTLSSRGFFTFYFCQTQDGLQQCMADKSYCHGVMTPGYHQEENSSFNQSILDMSILV